MKKFSKDHEWILVDNNMGTIGVTDYAQQQLGDVVYVSLTKDIGDEVSAGDDVAEIESVKSVSQVYSPVSGEITDFNQTFEDESKSGIVNEDPYGDGWILKIKLSNPDELSSLMDENQYNDYIKTL